MTPVKCACGFCQRQPRPEQRLTRLIQLVHAGTNVDTAARAVGIGLRNARRWANNIPRVEAPARKAVRP